MVLARRNKTNFLSQVTFSVLYKTDFLDRGQYQFIKSYLLFSSNIDSFGIFLFNSYKRERETRA